MLLSMMQNSTLKLCRKLRAPFAARPDCAANFVVENARRSGKTMGQMQAVQRDIVAGQVFLLDVEDAVRTIAIDHRHDARSLSLDGDRVGDIQITGGRIVLACPMQAEYVGAARHHDDISPGMGIGGLDGRAKRAEVGIAVAGANTVARIRIGIIRQIVDRVGSGHGGWRHNGAKETGDCCGYPFHVDGSGSERHSPLPSRTHFAPARGHDRQDAGAWPASPSARETGDRP